MLKYFRYGETIKDNTWNFGVIKIISSIDAFFRNQRSAAIDFPKQIQETPLSQHKSTLRNKVAIVFLRLKNNQKSDIADQENTGCSITLILFSIRQARIDSAVWRRSFVIILGVSINCDRPSKFIAFANSVYLSLHVVLLD